MKKYFLFFGLALSALNSLTQRDTDSRIVSFISSSEFSKFSSQFSSIGIVDYLKSKITYDDGNRDKPIINVLL